MQRKCKKCGLDTNRTGWGRYCFPCLIERKKEIKSISGKKYRDKNKEKLNECAREKYWGNSKKTCRNCHKVFFRGEKFQSKFCSRKCFYENESINRKGKKNPCFRNGTRVNGKEIDNKNVHLEACSKYRKNFLEINGRSFCENCGVNENGTPRFEVHHLCFASLFPRHKFLHDFRNLIFVCIKCHNGFHKVGGKKMFKRWAKERGLASLFGKEILL